MGVPQRYNKPLSSLTVSHLWQWVQMDIAYMSKTLDRYHLLVIASNSMSGWEEAQWHKQGKSDQAEDFIYEGVICSSRKWDVRPGMVQQRAMYEWICDWNVSKTRISPRTCKMPQPTECSGQDIESLKIHYQNSQSTPMNPNRCELATSWHCFGLPGSLSDVQLDIHHSVFCFAKMLYIW